MVLIIHAIVFLSKPNIIDMNYVIIKTEEILMTTRPKATFEELSLQHEQEYEATLEMYQKNKRRDDLVDNIIGTVLFAVYAGLALMSMAKGQPSFALLYFSISFWVLLFWSVNLRSNRLFCEKMMATEALFELRRALTLLSAEVEANGKSIRGEK